MNRTFRSDVAAASPWKTPSHFSPLIIVLFNWMFSGIPICTRLVVDVELLHEFGFNGFPDVAFYRGRVFLFGGSWLLDFPRIL
jgi:hypothetical protein